MREISFVPVEEYDRYVTHLPLVLRFTVEESDLENMVWREVAVSPRVEGPFYEGMGERSRGAWKYMLDHVECLKINR